MHLLLPACATCITSLCILYYQQVHLELPTCATWTVCDCFTHFPRVSSRLCQRRRPKWEQSIIKWKRARDWLRGRRWEKSRRIPKPSRRRQLTRKTKCFHREKSNQSAHTGVIKLNLELRRGISPKFGQFCHLHLPRWVVKWVKLISPPYLLDNHMNLDQHSKELPITNCLTPQGYVDF